MNHVTMQNPTEIVINSTFLSFFLGGTIDMSSEWAFESRLPVAGYHIDPMSNHPKTEIAEQRKHFIMFQSLTHCHFTIEDLIPISQVKQTKKNKETSW